MEDSQFYDMGKSHQGENDLMKAEQGTCKQRILFVGAFPPPDRCIFGGIATSCKIILQSSFAERANLTLLDTTQISNPPPSLGRRSVLAARRTFSYCMLFERNRPDAVLLMTSPGASILEKGVMAWYARFRGVPALLFPRGGSDIEMGGRSFIQRSWLRLAFGGARKVLCQGAAWNKFAVNLLGFHPEDAPIILNWTATPELLSIGRRRNFSAGDHPVRLLFLGWVEQYKGIFELIEACHRLSGSRKFVLNIVGEGNASARARELVAQHGLEDIIRFRGWLRGADLEAVLAESDVLVLPSWAEGMPNAMIEAMAAKLAVIVSAVGNVPDVIEDGCEALLVPAKNIDALQSALMQVIDDPVLRNKLAAEGFLLVERLFGVEQAADLILKAVNDAIVQSGGVKV
ncbi:MAG: glycosyltransferase family 4 protein [Gallionella sp.]|nr:glycosyltransferase family 4 protein [Gallionella sp.]